jgi:hypothetical protein
MAHRTRRTAPGPTPGPAAYARIPSTAGPRARSGFRAGRSETARPCQPPCGFAPPSPGDTGVSTPEDHDPSACGAGRSGRPRQHAAERNCVGRHTSRPLDRSNSVLPSSISNGGISATHSEWRSPTVPIATARVPRGLRIGAGNSTSSDNGVSGNRARTRCC